MNLYEVIPTFEGGLRHENGYESHVVIAPSKQRARKLIVDYQNHRAGYNRFSLSDYVANDPIAPDDYPEETVIN